MVKLETFDYNELIKHRGTKKCGFHEIGLKPDGSMMKIPYVIVVGEEEGPTLLMDGGIHGDEVEGGHRVQGVLDHDKGAPPDQGGGEQEGLCHFSHHVRGQVDQLQIAKYGPAVL